MEILKSTKLLLGKLSGVTADTFVSIGDSYFFNQEQRNNPFKSAGAQIVTVKAVSNGFVEYEASYGVDSMPVSRFVGCYSKKLAPQKSEP